MLLMAERFEIEEVERTGIDGGLLAGTTSTGEQDLDPAEIEENPYGLKGREGEWPRWAYIFGPTLFMFPITTVIAIFLLIFSSKHSAEVVAEIPLPILAFYWVMMILAVGIPWLYFELRMRRQRRRAAS